MNVTRSAILPYSAAQMYSVIRDIEYYPEFLNWCDSVAVTESNEARQIAEVRVRYGRLKISFTTENQLTRNEKIEMALVSGPFKQLNGAWSIQTMGENASKVSLNMAFRFQNPITHQLFGKVFQSVVTAQVDAFQKRAEQLYGR